MHASILNVKLNKINSYIIKRKNIAKIYLKELKNTSLKLPNEKLNCQHVFHLFTVYHSKRELIIKKLRSKNIEIKIYYPFPIHKMKAYKNIKVNKNYKLLVTEKMAKGIFSLPLYPELSMTEVYNVVKTLKTVLKTI